jgi:TPR repeat protein
MKTSEICKNAANKGDKSAEFVMGVLFLYGIEVQKSVNVSLGWFQKAAKGSYGPALFTLGVLYGKGSGVPKNAEKALNYLKLASEKGIAEASELIKEDPELKNDPPDSLFDAVSAYAETALSAFTKAKLNFTAPKSLKTGSVKKGGSASSPAPSGAGESNKFAHIANAASREKYLNSLRKKAEAGDIESGFTLGFIYSEGTLLLENLGNALSYFKKGAEQGYPPAMRELGLIYVKGEGPIARNRKEGFRLISQAASLGDPEAVEILQNPNARNRSGKKRRKWRGSRKALRLAKLLHREKFDFPKHLKIDPTKKNAVDPATFEKLYKRANERVDRKAIYRLGNIYYYGQGVPRDRRLARKFYATAAKLGLKRAQIKAAQIYYRDDDNPKSLLTAQSLYLDASESHVDSMFMLGKTMEKLGKATEDDHDWFQIKYYMNAINEAHRGAILELMRLYNKGGAGVELFHDILKSFTSNFD